MSEKQRAGILQITSVYYEQQRGTGHYAHETIGATTAVDGFESPEQALTELRAWVGEQLEIRGRADELIASCGTLKDEERALQEAVAMMRHRYESARAFLDKIGVPVPSSWHDESDLPF